MNKFICAQANQAYKTFQQFVNETKEIVIMTVFGLNDFISLGFP